MICSLIVKEGKKFIDVLEFFKKATNSIKIDVNFDLAHEKKL